ncbi:MAG: HAD family hydrolase [Oscillospiraceae bacterium]|nr:HAD family hydrolase [Oscillospiraceae bacterium]
MRYKAVLFDMDGTVLDTLGDLTNAVNHTLREFNMPELTRDEAAACLGNGAAWLIAHAVPAGTSEEQTAEVLRAYQPWYDSHCAILTAPYPGILPLMETLKERGVKQAVVSNKQDSAVKLLAERHFPGLLDTAVGESATVRRKPNPDAVLAALKHMGLELVDAVYVGDTEVDLATAQNAGMDCAIVGWGFRTEEQLLASGAARVFQTAEELLEWLTEE